MKSLWNKSVVVVSVVAISGAADAQDPNAGDPGAGPVYPGSKAHAAENYTRDTWPGEFVLRSVTVPKGMIQVNAPLGINLSKDEVGKPVFLAPNIYYGVTDDLQVGITHSVGICFTGKENGCPRVYDDVGLDVEYRFLRGDFDLAAHLALPVSSFDPFTLSVRLGVKGRVTAAEGKLALLFDPAIQFGITEREGVTVGETTVGGNKELLSLSLLIAFQATPQLAVGVGTNFGGPFDGFGDAYTGTLDVLGFYNISKMVDVFVQFSFTNLYGKHDTEGAIDGRLLAVGANIWL